MNIDRRAPEKKLFYRFHSPKDATYPEMIELFSRKIALPSMSDTGHLTPIPVDEEVSSLSAILLDGDYYRFIHAGKNKIEGLSVIPPGSLIPLKARAWLDLSSKSSSSQVDDKDIRKHKNDIFRLYQLLTADMRISLPPSVKTDMEKFVDQMKKIPSVDLKELGIKNIKYDEILKNLTQIYNL